VEAKLDCDAQISTTTETMHFVVEEQCHCIFKFPLPPRSAVWKWVCSAGCASGV